MKIESNKAVSQRPGGRCQIANIDKKERADPSDQLQGDNFTSAVWEQCIMVQTQSARRN